MILAAPLVIPFAKAVGLSVGTLGMAALADKVNDYIQDNPEESMKILSTIIPNVGIGQIFMSKEDKISLEDLDEMTDEEAQDLSKEEKAELMKQAGKSGGGKKGKRQTMIDISEKLGLSGPGREKQDIEYEIDERYDEGGVEGAPRPKFDYTKFFRKRRADGGAIGIEVLFTDKKPRKNFFMGGPALTGTALDIFNSMKAYGFPDAEIANALRARGLYDTTPAPTAPAMSLQPNITRPNGGGKDENDTGGIKNTSSLFGNLNDEDYEADAYGIGPTIGGTFARMKQGLGNIVTTLRGLPTPVNIALKAIENIRDPYKNVFGGLNKQTRDAIARESVRDLQGRIDRGDFGSTTPTPQDAARGGGGRGGSRGGRSAGFDQGERGGPRGR